MGEYAKYKGQSIKIGTCEEMYYLRADQAHLVQPMSNNLDPIKQAEMLRFRFPFPDEDGTEPGAFEDYNRAVPVYGVKAPKGVEHGNVQFTAPGYCTSIPCPEAGEVEGLTIHRNGFAGAVQVTQQRLVNGRLALICRCGGCGAKWRLETEEEAAPIVAALEAEVTRQAKADPIRAQWTQTIANRIIDGYRRPPAALVRLHSLALAAA